MAGPTGNPYGGANRHADVLGESPEDGPAKLRLVEEVKNRAKGAFQQKDMVSAELLYGKAISLLEGLPGKAEAALYSNRSMVRLNLSKVDESLADADKCLELDPKFVKAHHRRAQALLRLNEFDSAIAAARAGAALEPDSKAFAEVIEKAEKEKARDVEEKARLKRDAQDVRVELHNASTARAPPRKEPRAGEAEDTSMRGYKTTSDGRKTSYFHTEISEEAKRLIAEQGFGKPQRIEGPAPADQPAKGGGSQWNQAGTYEEKGMTQWAQERLTQQLKGLTFQIPAGNGGGSISTTGVQDIKGTATISASRGKRRHILDMSCDVAYEAKVGDVSGKGKLALSEITADDEPEVSVEISQDTPGAVREVLAAFVKPAGQGLQPVVLAEIRKFIEEYKGK